MAVAQDVAFHDHGAADPDLGPFTGFETYSITYDPMTMMYDTTGYFTAWEMAYNMRDTIVYPL